MKKNYIYIALGIIALIAWVVDILWFFGIDILWFSKLALPLIWKIVKVGYALLGLSISLSCFSYAIPENKENSEIHYHMQ